ncbi:MAG: hypothetical protein EPN21_15410 [Methylococcaceae bacterium]|nr:MAG: hypothetical protein EPN21_15410 [Methylococcaceae bacterium]
MHTCCKPVKDFLDYGRELHGEIQAFYDTLSEQSDKERVRMLLDYLSRHEKTMEESLHRFEQVTRQSILAVWLEHVPRLSIQEIIDECGIKAGATLDDVLAIALKFDAAMIKLYRDVAENAKDARVKEVFNNIADMEVSEDNKLLRSVSMLREM